MSYCFPIETHRARATMEIVVLARYQFRIMLFSWLILVAVIC